MSDKTNHTPPRSIRVKQELWSKARAKAQSEGRDLTGVVVAALEEYVAEED